MASIVMFGVFFAFCVTLASTRRPSTTKALYQENIRKLTLANNELAFNLHRKLVSGSSENVFFSPFSISTVFAMLFQGTRGDTAKELRHALGYEKAGLENEYVSESFQNYLGEVLKNDNSSYGHVLNTANAVLVDKRLKLLEEYRRNVQELYRATVRDVDFERDSPKIVEEINAWVKAKMDGKIEKILDRLSPGTVLILLNAVYFKGIWKIHFEPEDTRHEIFYNNGIEERFVQMMHVSSKFPFTCMEDFKVLELPFKGENVSMLILLPNKRDGLEALEKRLSPGKLSRVQRRLRRTKVDVSLPKFKIELEKELSSELRALGANRIFSAGSTDFSGMTPSRNVLVNQIIHKAVIEVNEEGSEVAAVTGTRVVIKRATRGIPKFRANHPFLFAVVEKGSNSNMILFLGRVNNLKHENGK